MKAMVLFSGGLDSTTALALAIKRYGMENVVPLSVTYGQKHRKELEAATNVLKFYHLKGRTLDLGAVFADSNCSLLAHSSEDVPEASYQEQLAARPGQPVSTYVPFRNGLFLSCAASMALSAGCGVLYYGIHMDDAAGSAYPDCSAVFNEAMNTAIYEGSGHQLQVIAPFVTMNKAQIVKLGLELGVPYELTWSCYEGHEKACGRCGTCIDRRNAFRANGVEDPVPYEAADIHGGDSDLDNSEIVADEDPSGNGDNTAERRDAQL